MALADFGAVLYAVVVAVDVERIGLREIEAAVTVGILAAIDEAVVIGVGVDRTGPRRRVRTRTGGAQ